MSERPAGPVVVIGTRAGRPAAQTISQGQDLRPTGPVAPAGSAWPTLYPPGVSSCVLSISTFDPIDLFGAPQFADAVCRGNQHGQAAEGNTCTSSCARQGQHVGEDQHSTQADGTNAKKDGGSCRDVTGGPPCRPPNARVPVRQ